MTPQAAKARWQALDKFVEASGHLLVTNGPYRLTSWSPEATVLDVMRDFSYPIGLGTFNVYAYPARGGDHRPRAHRATASSSRPMSSSRSSNSATAVSCASR